MFLFISMCTFSIHIKKMNYCVFNIYVIKKKYGKKSSSNFNEFGLYIVVVTYNMILRFSD